MGGVDGTCKNPGRAYIFYLTQPSTLTWKMKKSTYLFYSQLHSYHLTVTVKGWRMEQIEESVSLLHCYRDMSMERNRLLRMTSRVVGLTRQEVYMLHEWLILDIPIQAKYTIKHLFRQEVNMLHEWLIPDITIQAKYSIKHGTRQEVTCNMSS